MDPLAQLRLAAEYAASQPRTIELLTETFGSEFWTSYHPSMLVGVAEHRCLFTKYTRAAFRRFYDLTAASEAMTPADILLYFVDLKLYALVDSLSVLEDFAHNAQDIIDRGERFAMNQIVFEHQKQKLIIISTDASEDFVRKIQKYGKEHLGQDAVIEHRNDDNTAQITFNIDFDSYASAAMEFLEFQAKVRVADADLAKAISIIPRQRVAKVRYIDPSINGMMEAYGADEMMRVLAGIPKDLTYNNVNINIMIGNNNVQKIAAVPDNRGGAKEWIRDNPPDDREITTAYYDRYCAANRESPMANSNFGKLVRKQGFKTSRNTSGRYWHK
jgi:hypothetical protein